MSISKLTLHHLEHFIKPNLQETRRWNYELGLIFSYQILAFMLNYLFEQATNFQIFKPQMEVIVPQL